MCPTILTPVKYINSLTEYRKTAIYADEKLLSWFKNEYLNHTKLKLDMGKNCIRFKNIDQIPYNLIVELAKRVTPQKWIKQYEQQIKPQ